MPQGTSGNISPSCEGPNRCRNIKDQTLVWSFSLFPCPNTHPACTLYTQSLGHSLAEQWTFWLIPLPRRPTRNLPCLRPELLHRDPNLVTADIRGWVMLRGREGCRVHYRMFSDIPDLPPDVMGTHSAPHTPLRTKNVPDAARGPLVESHRAKVRRKPET